MNTGNRMLFMICVHWLSSKVCAKHTSLMKSICSSYTSKPILRHHITNLYTLYNHKSINKSDGLETSVTQIKQQEEFQMIIVTK